LRGHKQTTVVVPPALLARADEVIDEIWLFAAVNEAAVGTKPT
jgi:hypothetical protein